MIQFWLVRHIGKSAGISGHVFLLFSFLPFFFFKGKCRKLVLFMPQVIIVSWHDLSSQCPWEGTRLRANLSPWRQQSRIKIIGVLRVIIILLNCQLWTQLTKFFLVCVCVKANLKILIPSLKSFGVCFWNNNAQCSGFYYWVFLQINILPTSLSVSPWSIKWLCIDREWKRGV